MESLEKSENTGKEYYIVDLVNIDPLTASYEDLKALSKGLSLGTAGKTKQDYIAAIEVAKAELNA
ncbi:hypothetical protein [Flavobacterium kingsejongi]|nr:hypothetical protein [Flavobacterium kingsejongi]